MIDIERRLCLNEKSTDKTSSITNLIDIAKEKVFDHLMLSNIIFHYILFQTTHMKIFQFESFEG